MSLARNLGSKARLTLSSIGSGPVGCGQIRLEYSTQLWSCIVADPVLQHSSAVRGHQGQICCSTEQCTATATAPRSPFVNAQSPELSSLSRGSDGSHQTPCAPLVSRLSSRPAPHTKNRRAPPRSRTRHARPPRHATQLPPSLARPPARTRTARDRRARRVLLRLPAEAAGPGGGDEAPGPAGADQAAVRLLPPRVGGVGAAGGGGSGGHRGAGAARVPLRGAGRGHAQLLGEAEARAGRLRARVPGPARRRPGGGRQAAGRRVQAGRAGVQERGQPAVPRPAPQRRQPARLLRPRRRREAARLRVRPQREPRQDPLLRRRPAARRQQQDALRQQQQRRRQAAPRGADVGAAAGGGGGRGAGAAVPTRGRAHPHHPPRHQGQQHPPRRPLGGQDRRLRHGPPLPGGRRRPLPRPDPRRRHQRLHGPRVPHARPPLRQGRRLQLRRPRPRDRLRPQELLLHPAAPIQRRQPPRLRLEAVQGGAEHGAAGPVGEGVGRAGPGAHVHPHRAAVRAGGPAAAAGHEARGHHPLQEAEHAGGADAARAARVALPEEGAWPAQLLAVLRRVVVGHDPVDVACLGVRIGVGFERDDDVEHAHAAEPGAPVAPGRAGRAGAAQRQLKPDAHCTYVHSFSSCLFFCLLGDSRLDNTLSVLK